MAINVVFEDKSFKVSDSPAIHNVNSALGKNSNHGYITNDGPGNLLIEESNDGSSFGSEFTLKSKETFIFDGQEGGVHTIKVNWSKQDSAYRINLT